MKIVKLPKENLGQFITHLSAFGETHAPVRKGDEGFAFAPVLTLINQSSRTYHWQKLRDSSQEKLDVRQCPLRMVGTSKSIGWELKIVCRKELPWSGFQTTDSTGR